jgi:N-acetylglucosamine malate deacetylase 1
VVLSVVAVNAHPDDEMSCLGTLLKCRDRGDRVTLVAVSRAEKGGGFDPTIPDEEVAAMRQREAERVAEGLGATYVCLGADDGLIRDEPDLRMALVSVLRRVSADVILTAPPVDYSMDHVTTGRIATQAALLSAVPPHRRGEPALERPPAMFHMDTITGLDFQPWVYVDITAQFERKCELLRLHGTQMLSQKQFVGWDLVTHAEVVGRFRGLQAGVGYAEGFQPVLRNPLIRPGMLLP